MDGSKSDERCNAGRRSVIGVIGPARAEYPASAGLVARLERDAEAVGRLLAEAGAVVMTGGTDGVMEASSRGAKLAGGLTLGTPGRVAGSSNRFVDIEILTPVDVGDFLFAGCWTCNAFIVFPGGAGTLAELCLAYRLKKPVVIMQGYDQSYDRLVGGFLDNGKSVKVLGASSPKEAVANALRAAQDINRPGEL